MSRVCARSDNCLLRLVASSLGHEPAEKCRVLSAWLAVDLVQGRKGAEGMEGSKHRGRDGEANELDAAEADCAGKCGAVPGGNWLAGQPRDQYHRPFVHASSSSNKHQSVCQDGTSSWVGPVRSRDFWDRKVRLRRQTYGHGTRFPRKKCLCNGVGWW